MNQAVFDHFRDVRFSSAHPCSEMTGVPLEQVTATMREMVRLGHLAEVAGCPGLYQYYHGLNNHSPFCKPTPEFPVPDLQRKLWWAMSLPHNAPAPFTAFDIAQMAGSSLKYARRYIYGLLNRKLLTRIGNGRYRISTTAPTASCAPSVKIQLGG